MTTNNLERIHDEFQPEYIKPPRRFSYEEGLRAASTVATRLQTCPVVDKVLLCGSLARGFRGDLRDPPLIGDLDLVAVSTTGWYKFRALMQNRPDPNALISKSDRLMWASQALEPDPRSNQRWESPLEPYFYHSSSYYWQPRINASTGEVSPVPTVDIFVFPPFWEADRRDEVLYALSYSYVAPQGLVTWAASEFLSHVQQEAITFTADLLTTPIGEEGWQI